MREFAIELARRAGALALSFHERGLRQEQIRTKMHRADLVTEADFAVESLIIEAVQARFPDHAIYGEESADGSVPEVEWLWLVDPIDGTTNFAHGLPIFCINIALARNGHPVLGVTYEPAAGRVYWAERGMGAMLRNADDSESPLRASNTRDLGQALLATGFAHGRRSSTPVALAEFAALDAETHAVRRLGSAALAQAWVATGWLDAYWEAELKPWDAAAGLVLIEEAGGRVTDSAGKPWRLSSPGIVASNGSEELHGALLRTIRETNSSMLYLVRGRV